MPDTDAGRAQAVVLTDVAWLNSPLRSAWLSAHADNVRTMPIATEQISQQQLTALFDIEEGHFIDLKRIEVKPSKLTKSISAFANADGGELYVGIGENHEKTERFWSGFVREEDANGHLQAFEVLFPLGHGFEYEFLETDGETGLVLHVYIARVLTSRSLRTTFLTCGAGRRICRRLRRNKSSDFGLPRGSRPKRQPRSKRTLTTLPTRSQ